MKMILPNIDTGSVKDMIRFAASYPGSIHCMMGLHPGSVNGNYKQELTLIRQYLDTNMFTGVGEIGLDSYWDNTYMKQQIDVFKTQCQWAVEKKLPVSIHSRSATDEALALLKSLPEIPDGIFHCFDGNIFQAKEVINAGFKIGVGGVVTFKNSKLRNVLEKIDPKNLVLETDAPYLAPHPYRGKRNEPAMLRLVAEKLAEIYTMPADKIINLTGKTAARCFKLSVNEEK